MSEIRVSDAALLEMLRLPEAGLSQRAIARRLGWSRATVAVRLQAIDRDLAASEGAESFAGEPAEGAAGPHRFLAVHSAGAAAAAPAAFSGRGGC